MSKCTETDLIRHLNPTAPVLVRTIAVRQGVVLKFQSEGTNKEKKPSAN